ncbi:hypothetical protein [Octadecabacter ascidiaceicola]|uniref:Uncharacterized protein n=1 Tax=Octadecabacter ascidiaceicola TaxID=1655543 RepID=A0A238K5U5_9RHOB|nr:hypothetical protein [Octadecabacter ascidiaceicola]SMX38280.1 hypothetical protein OCA8868_01772 [Octadecabacter ascidiaceicola]
MDTRFLLMARYDALPIIHRDWKMLRRYTNFKLEDLHKFQTIHQPSEDEIIRKIVKGV